MASSPTRFRGLYRGTASSSGNLAPHADELVAMGLADMRPEVMPRRFDEAFATAGDYVGRQGSAEDRDTLARVEGLRETYAS